VRPQPYRFDTSLTDKKRGKSSTGGISVARDGPSLVLVGLFDTGDPFFETALRFGALRGAVSLGDWPGPQALLTGMVPCRKRSYWE
jgi:hypothetical protein